MSNPAFAKRVYRLQVLLVRELNDAHIFLEQCQPALTEVRREFEASQSKSKRRYYVPFEGRTKFAKRTDEQLKGIYDRYISIGLFEAFLVSSLSRFEAFLSDLMFEFFTIYPRRITERVQGIPACPEISAVDLISASDKERLLQDLIREHLGNVFRQRPKLYMSYLCKLLGVADGPSFLDYYEIAATRDLLVHNSCVVNDLYVEKAGAKVRGAVGERLIVDKTYFYGALGKMKRVSGAIKRDVERKYGAASDGTDANAGSHAGS
jgi:hypothetical protein